MQPSRPAKRRGSVPDAGSRKRRRTVSGGVPRSGNIVLLFQSATGRSQPAPTGAEAADSDDDVVCLPPGLPEGRGVLGELQERADVSGNAGAGAEKAVDHHAPAPARQHCGVKMQRHRSVSATPQQQPAEPEEPTRSGAHCCLLRRQASERIDAGPDGAQSAPLGPRRGSQSDFADQSVPATGLDLLDMLRPRGCGSAAAGQPAAGAAAGGSQPPGASLADVTRGRPAAEQSAAVGGGQLPTGAGSPDPTRRAAAEQPAACPATGSQPPVSVIDLMQPRGPPAAVQRAAVGGGQPSGASVIDLMRPRSGWAERSAAGAASVVDLMRPRSWAGEEPRAPAGASTTAGSSQPPRAGLLDLMRPRGSDGEQLPPNAVAGSAQPSGASLRPPGSAAAATAGSALLCSGASRRTEQAANTGRVTQGTDTGADQSGQTEQRQAEQSRQRQAEQSRQRQAEQSRQRQTHSAIPRRGSERIVAVHADTVPHKPGRPPARVEIDLTSDTESPIVVPRCYETPPTPAPTRSPVQLQVPPPVLVRGDAPLPAAAVPWVERGRCRVLELESCGAPSEDTVSAKVGAGFAANVRVALCRDASGRCVLLALCDGWCFQSGGGSELQTGTPVNIIAHGPRRRGAAVWAAPTATIVGGTHDGAEAVVVSDRLHDGVGVVAVTHPHRSVRATAVSDAATCVRKAWLSSRCSEHGWGGGMACLEGATVHDAVQQLSLRPQSIPDACVEADAELRAAVGRRACDFAAAGCTETEAVCRGVRGFTVGAAAAAAVLRGHRTDQIRVRRIRAVERRVGESGSAHGLHGNVDVVADIEDAGAPASAAIEIKTQQHLRKWQPVMKPQHRAQLLSYLLLLSEAGEPSIGSLVYLVKGEQQPYVCRVDLEGAWMEACQVVRLRNGLVRFEGQDMQPPPPQFAESVCRFCSRAAVCAGLAADTSAVPDYVLQRASKQYVADGDPPPVPADADWSYARKWHRILALEAAAAKERRPEEREGQEARREQSILSRQRGSVVQVIADPRAERLRRLVIGLSPPAPPVPAEMSWPSGWRPPVQLNHEQVGAVRVAAGSPDYAIVQGLPGTGKTAVISALVSLLVAKGRRVLVCAGTHSAVDTVCLRLLEAGVTFARAHLSTVRDWSNDNVHPKVRPFIWDGATGTVEGCRAVAEGPQVVCITASSLHHPFMARARFSDAVIDEAGQITQPVALGVMLLAERVTFVGDHNQLPPVVRSKEALDAGADRSFLAALSQSHPSSVVTLGLQYRMCEEIQLLPNAAVYGGLLRCGAPEIASRTLPLSPAVAGPEWLAAVVDPAKPVVFADVSGVGSAAAAERNVNEVEAGMIAQALAGVDASARAPISCLVTSPFRPQVEFMQRRLSGSEWRRLSVEIMTVDQSQGRDVDLVLVSLVKREGDHMGAHLRDPRRLNVAFTRARAKLVVVGSISSVFDKVEEWRKVTELSQQRGWRVRVCE
eukprot:TRINITY_DN3987_c0_g1_i1.p1 TRINITY_DN3987_c0_g1~~TRINITY_DN3987_c0_g1_i1.p1  ORF type:complete len:1475 (+),score=424.53 TRINITY_DN3987_c0_g1_i1:42-4427(+)